MRQSFLFVLFGFLAVSVACSGEVPSDKNVVESSTDQSLSFVRYYSIENDFRKCVSPLCGGFWVRELNKKYTLCADYTYQDRCYVASLDWQSLQLPPSQQAELQGQAKRLVVHGNLSLKKFANFGNLGILRAKKAWRSATEVQPSGYFYGMRRTEIVCITHPCPGSYWTASVLNYSSQYRVEQLDLSAAQASQEQQDQAQNTMRNEDVPVAGTMRTVVVDKKRVLKLSASQFYLAVTAAECNTDLDCTMSAHTQPVKSKSDCYCPMCPTAMPVSKAELYTKAWESTCQTWWQERPCPMPMCMYPGEVACIQNKCGFRPREL